MEEAFSGIIKFNPWLLSLDILLIIWFLSGWYVQYRRTGSYIDYWHYTLFLGFFIPVLVMYPFSSSSLNMLTVGYQNIDAIERSINEAYLVTITGFGAAYAGKYVYDHFRPLFGVEMLIAPFATTLGKCYVAVTTNPNVSRVFALIYILMMSAFIGFMISTGSLTNPREFFMLNTQYRPIYTFILSTFEVSFLIISTRALQYNKTTDKLLIATLVLFGFFLGVRAPLFLHGLSFGVLYVLYRKKGYLPPAKVGIFILATLFLIMLFAFVRNNSRGNDLDFSIALASFIPDIFYGNTFSDVRDFSWVLGYWNREHYWGMSYLAASLSFIPSYIYPIRDVYGIGKITVITAGLDPTLHPGLRMGLFGEMYLNFGLVGVLLFGFVWGYIQRRVDALTRWYAGSGNVVRASSVLVYSSFISYLTVSAGFWGLYLTIFLLFVLYLATRLRLDR